MSGIIVKLTACRRECHSVTAINFESFDSLLSKDVNEARTTVQLMMNIIMDELNCPRERICHG